MGWKLGLVETLCWWWYCYKLSEELVSILHSKGVHYLIQGGKRSDLGTRVEGWKSAQDLGLGDPYMVKWGDSVGGLNQFGISLSEKGDSLFWSGNLGTREVTTQFAYAIQFI